jgi:hypothetical protein
MLQLITKLSKLTALLIVLLTVPCAANYKPVLVSIYFGGMVFVQQTSRFKEYFWAAALLAIAVAVSPLPLAFKMFLLTGFTCVAAYVTLLAALPARLVPVD